MFASGWFTKGRFLVQKAFENGFRTGEHKGWGAGYEASYQRNKELLEQVYSDCRE